MSVSTKRTAVSLTTPELFAFTILSSAEHINLKTKKKQLIGECTFLSIFLVTGSISLTIQITNQNLLSLQSLRSVLDIV
jgi:hypothetical protein